MRFFKICLSISMLFSFFSGNAQQNIGIKDFVKTQLDSCYSKDKLPGVMVYYCDGLVTNLYTTGYANIKTKQVFNKNTVFEAGSITKTFTAYILQSILKEKGISDTTSIISYLPDSLQSNISIQHITFISLLNHTSGLPRLPSNFIIEDGDLQPYKNYDLPKLFAYLKTANVPVIKTSNYSNLGNALAGILASVVSKKPFVTLMEQYIYKPFKMLNVEQGLLKNKNKSQGYFSENTIAPYWDMNIMYPAGGLKTNATQLLTYLTNIANPAEATQINFVNKLLSPSVTVNNKIKVASAWHTFEQVGKPIIYWHNGGTYGFSTFVGFVKGSNKKVLVVINKFNANATSDFLGISIMKKLLQE